MRERLIELIVNADTYDSYEFKLCTKDDDACDCCYASKDLVEVVRCKDCERAKMYVFGCGNTEHLACVDTDDNGEIVFAQAVEPNHFCGYGTPKKEVRGKW